MVTVPSPVRGGYRRGVSFALRVALAAAIVWWLIRTAGWEEVVATLGHADPWFLVAAAIALCCESAAKSWNWGRLLDDLGASSAGRRAELWHVYMVASLVGSVLPSTASTDAMRGILAQRLFGGRPTAHAAAIIINNLLVWIAACSLGLVCMGVLFAEGQLPDYEYLAAPLFLGVVVAGVGLHIALKYYRRLWLLALRARAASPLVLPAPRDSPARRCVADLRACARPVCAKSGCGIACGHLIGARVR